MNRRRSASLTVDDLGDIRRLIGLVRDIAQRYAHLAETASTVFEHQLAQDEALRDFFEESGRQADRVAERIERLERLAILRSTGSNPDEVKSTQRDISIEHHDRYLRQELTQQTKNLERARLRAAKHGIDIPTGLQNEMDGYEEAIARIREELKQG